jgi:hypothetical protein
MSCIKIDKKLQKSQVLADFFDFLLMENRIKIPRLSLPKLLLAKARPGLDSEVTSTAIISRFSEIGIPTGPLENGKPNVMEAYTKAMVEEIYDSIHSEMRVDVAVDQGMIVTSAGGNSGGPVASTGSNPSPHTATGVGN